MTSEDPVRAFRSVLGREEGRFLTLYAVFGLMPMAVKMVACRFDGNGVFDRHHGRRPAAFPYTNPF